MASKFQIETSRKPKAVKFVFYGPEGIGKSTLASMLPWPIFIDTEGSTDHMNVPRYPRPKSWDSLLEMVDDAAQMGGIKTLIIDTADWAERLCSESLCAAKGWKGIEDAGYGKGYVYLREKFGQLLDKLTTLQDAGINVGFTAHAQLRKVENPEDTGAFDHWELKCSKQVAPMLKEWADLLLFLNYKTMVIHGATAMDKNKVVGGKRVIYTTHNPVWDAKNRFGLPEELPLEYASIRSVFDRGAAGAAKEDPKPEPEPKPEPKATVPPPEDPALLADPFLPEAPKPEEEWTEEEKKAVEPVQIADVYPELAQLMAGSNISEAEIMAAVGNRGYFPGDMPIVMYPADFVKGCLVADWAGVKKMITEMRRA